MASSLSSMFSKKDDDLKASYRNYEIQLQQVDAALSAFKNEDETEEELANKEELIKLKADLEHVMSLTRQLIESEKRSNSGDNKDGDSDETDLSETFKAGDIVYAPWSENGLYYRATIEDITSDGQCNVYFLKREEKGKRKFNFNHRNQQRSDEDDDDDGFKGGFNEVCLVQFIKPIASNRSNNQTCNDSKYKSKSLNNDDNGSGGGSGSGASKKVKRWQQQLAREAQKRKQQKKNQRLRELEDEREKDKNRWQSFHSKFKSQSKKSSFHSLNQQSIFASPSTIEGKVGVGTCGIGGKPMTDYVVGEKHKRATRLHKPSASTIASSSLSITAPSSVNNFTTQFNR